MISTEEAARLRYPIGKFNPAMPLTDEQVAVAILTIAALPARLQEAVANLTPTQLDTPYRDGGWTVRQVVHHLPDSHLNGYTRQKLALTEETPTIRPYREGEWAMLPDSLQGAPEISIVLLAALHQRWVSLLRAMGDEDFRRVYVHPETGRHTLDHLVALYAWHGPHHVAHITMTRINNGWQQ